MYNTNKILDENISGLNLTQTQKNILKVMLDGYNNNEVYTFDEKYIDDLKVLEKNELIFSVAGVWRIRFGSVTYAITNALLYEKFMHGKLQIMLDMVTMRKQLVVREI